jgi:hypothetical protein
MNWEIERIITAANDLATYGTSQASTGEQIAAAFVLNRLEFLPPEYRDAVEAWDRLGPHWQEQVRRIKQDHQQDLVPW